MLDVVKQDVGFALRQLARAPGFAALVVVTLAVGVGGNVAIFSVLKGVVLRPVPYPEPHRLVAVWESPPGQRGYQPFTSPDYFDVREQSDTLEELGAYHPEWFNLSGEGRPERIRGGECTASLLRVLGVPPARGRLFRDEEEAPGNDRVAILSHSLWQERFGGAFDVVGRSITLDGLSHLVVGIMPERFEFPAAWGGRDDTRLWVPLVLSREDSARASHRYATVGRLAQGRSSEQAEAELKGIASRLAAAHPDTNARTTMWVEPAMERTLGSVRSALFFLLGVVGLVLLIACANVASVLLARGARRLAELAIRSAIGAPRGRLVGQLLTESVMLAVLGGVAGLALARWGVTALEAILPASVPRVSGIAIDWQVLAYSAVVAALTGLAFGLAPAVMSSRVDLVGVLGSGRAAPGGGRGRHRFLGALVGTQLAIGFVLVNAAGVLLESYHNVVSQRMNFESERTLTAGIVPAGPGYEEPHQRRAFWRELVESARRLPGVVEAGLTSKLPLLGGSNGSVLIDGQVFDPNVRRELVEYSFVDEGYHRAMAIGLVAGRALTAADLERSAVAAGDESRAVELPVVINRTMAKKLWPREDPLGRRVRNNGAEERYRARVVGVVNDVRQWGPEREPLPEMYIPYTAEVWGPLRGQLVVRTAGDPLALAAGVREALKEVDPQVPLAELSTMAGVVQDATARRRFSMQLVALFAVTALILIVSGSYGVMSYAVSQRTHEIGVRAALGADRQLVFRLFLSRAARQLGSGLAIGVVGALAAARATRAMVYGVSASSPQQLLVAAAVMIAVGLGAVVVPVIRATRVNPVEALRTE